MKIKKLEEWGPIELLIFGIVFIFTGYALGIFFENKGLVMQILSIIIMFTGLVFFAAGVGKLLKPLGEREIKEILREDKPLKTLEEIRAEDKIREEEKIKRERNEKITGLIVSISCILITLSVNYYMDFRRKQMATEECKTCCSFVETNKVWVDNCCPSMFYVVTSSESCLTFSSQELCYNSCVPRYIKQLTPQFPSWLKILSIFSPSEN